MKTKYVYFVIGEDLFYNSSDFIIRVRVNSDYPAIETLEAHTVEYYNKNWNKHIVEISKERFEKRFKEILKDFSSKVDF